MFGGFGGALKNLTGKAEEAIERTKKEVESLAIEKKQKATELLEAQAKKTGDAILHGKTELEKTAAGVATDAKKQAIDGFDKEVSGAEKKVDECVKETESQIEASAPAADAGTDAITGALGSLSGLSGMANIDQEINKTVDGAVQEVSKTVDEKLKEADKAIDEKRDEVLHQLQEKATVASQSAGDSVGSVLGKAKGLLKYTAGGLDAESYVSRPPAVSEEALQQCEMTITRIF